MARYNDLKFEVDRLNNKYCSKSKNELVIDRAYGGYDVHLRAKTGKNGKLLKTALGSGATSICGGHGTANETLSDLYKSESRGWLQNTIKQYNKRK